MGIMKGLLPDSSDDNVMASSDYITFGKHSSSPSQR
jgi:hypothetical protein